MKSITIEQSSRMHNRRPSPIDTAAIAESAESKPNALQTMPVSTPPSSMMMMTQCGRRVSDATKLAQSREGDAECGSKGYHVRTPHGHNHSTNIANTSMTLFPTLGATQNCNSRLGRFASNNSTTLFGVNNDSFGCGNTVFDANESTIAKVIPTMTFGDDMAGGYPLLSPPLQAGRAPSRLGASCRLPSSMMESRQCGSTFPSPELGNDVAFTVARLHAVHSDMMMQISSALAKVHSAQEEIVRLSTKRNAPVTDLTNTAIDGDAMILGCHVKGASLGVMLLSHACNVWGANELSTVASTRLCETTPRSELHTVTQQVLMLWRSVRCVFLMIVRRLAARVGSLF